MVEEYDRFEADYEGMTVKGEIDEGDLTIHEDGEEIRSILDGETEEVKQISNEIYNLTQGQNQTAAEGEVRFYHSDSVESYELPAIQHLPFMVETYLKELPKSTV